MSDGPEETQARKSSWVTLLYYYLAALTGLVIVIVGAIMAVNSGVDAIFFEKPQPPAEQDFYCYDCPNDRGDALEDAVKGALTAAVGFPIFLWHIRNARRKEDER